MDYKTFFERFGGSARTKHITSNPFSLRRSNRRKFILPARSDLPKEYIRLCPWEMEYLFTVARRARKGIVEIGRFNGGSCFLMACAAPDVPIYSVDIKPQNDDLLRNYFELLGVGKNVHLIIGDSQYEKFPQVTNVDMLFIDGDHSYKGCMNDLTNWYDLLNVNGHLILHDCYCGKHGVQDAVTDFMESHSELQILQSPFIGAMHWHYPAGSLTHFVRRG